MTDFSPTLDRSALRVNQATIVVLLTVAFVGGWLWLVAGVAAVMAIGAVIGRPGFAPVYTHVLRPAGWVRPDRATEDPAPHRFAQGLGAAMLAAAWLALLGDHLLAGWTLAWLVVALASFNLASGICIGCTLHYTLARLGVRGFGRAASSRGGGKR